MNIIHVIRDLSPNTGGPVSAVLGMAGAQAAAGHAVSIISTDYHFDTLPDVGEVKVHLYPCKLPGWRLSRQLGKAMPWHIKNADIVHIHMIWEHPAWLASRICRRMQKPYIIRPCGMLDKWSLAQNAWKKKAYLRLLGIPILQNAAALHFTTEREYLNSVFFGSNARKIVVPIGLGRHYYEDLPSHEAFRKRYQVLNGKRNILFLGRLHYKKQPDIVIRAFKEACGSKREYQLVLAGLGERRYVAGLRQLVRQLDLEERVTFTGILKGEAVREALRAAEVFVLPSLQENFGIAVAEAMAAGCPVVVSNQVDLSPEISSNNAGIVCSPQADEVAAAIAKLIDDEDLRNEMGENGRRLILEKFTWEKVTVDLIAVYNDIMAGKGPVRCETKVCVNE